jgi:orotate phosphoribosyltransferase
MRGMLARRRESQHPVRMNSRSLPTTTPLGEIETDLLDAVSAARGHFRYESGHHGDLWLDLDGLFVDARRAWAWAFALAGRAAACAPDFVCGPLTGGAFVAQWVAAELGAGFVYAERSMDAEGVARYRVPDTLRDRLRGARVLLVDDAVNAGSALLGTLDDLRACGAEPAGFGSLLALGDAAARIGGRLDLPFHTLVSLEREMWSAAECPLCAAGTPLVDHVPRA